MTSAPEPNDLGGSFTSRLLNIRSFYKRDRRRKQVSTAQRNRAAGTLLQAQRLLDKSTLECYDALNYFTSHRSVSRDLGTDLAEAKEQAGTLRDCSLAICVLGRTTDEWIGKDTQLVITTLVFLLSAILVHLGYILHNRWLYMGMENMWRDYKWVTESLDSVLGISVPWGFSATRSYTTNIRLTKKQRHHCKKIIARGRFDELHKVFSAIKRRPYWRRLTRSRYPPGHVRKVFQHITLLVEKINLICKRGQWEALILKVPADLSTTNHTFSDLLASADSHLEDIKPQINTVVDRWIGDRSDKFKFRHEDMKMSKWTGHDITWLVESEQYQSWYKAASGTDGRFLWGVGGIGVGKSCLMHASVEYQKKEVNNTSPQTIIVELYFHQDNPVVYEEVMVEISQQVLTHIQGPTNFTVWIYDQLTRELATDTKANLLYMMLYELVTTHDVYFFLDGLDEIDQDIARGLVNMLMLLGSTHRIMCFSRRCASICDGSYSKFTFWDIPSREADLATCLERVLPTLERHVGTELPEEAKPALLDRITADSQGSYLLLAGQLESIMSQDPPRNILPSFDIIPDAAFPRYRATMSRIKTLPIRGERIFQLIAWVGALRTLSVTGTIPHLRPKLPVREAPAIRRLVDDSYGILRLVDGNVTFASYVGEAYVCAEFAELFPEFVAKVRAAARPPSRKLMPKVLVDRFEDFMATRYGRHKLLIRDLAADVDGGYGS